MPSHKESRILPYAAEQMFDLVADIRAYPQFLPWVAGMRVRGQDGNVMTADMIVGFRALRESFTTRITLDRPRQVHIDYVSGPLKHLNNDWFFKDIDGGCEIDFSVDFAFHNRVFEKLAGAFFHEAFRRMVAAFEKRAAVVYSAPTVSGSSSSSAQRTA